MSVFDASKLPALILPKPKSFPAPIVDWPDSGVAVKMLSPLDFNWDSSANLARPIWAIVT